MYHLFLAMFILLSVTVKVGYSEEEQPLPLPEVIWGDPTPPKHLTDPPHDRDKHPHGPESLLGHPLPCPYDSHLSDDGSHCVKFDEHPIRRFEGKLIAGKVSEEEALAILDRHKHELARIKGISSVRLHEDGFIVSVRPNGDPLGVPREIEGIPVKVLMDAVDEVRSHSMTNIYSPMRGGYAIADESDLQIHLGAATGYALTRGAPWLLFPTHLLQKIHTPSGLPLCRANSLCPPNQSMHLCGGYGPPPLDTIYQAPQLFVGPNTTVGWAGRWDPHQISWGPGFPPTTDLAAAYADNNFVNDGSHPVDNVIDGYGMLQGQANPVPGEPVSVYTAGSVSEYPNVHVKHGFVAQGFEFDCDGFISGPSHDFTSCVGAGVCSDYGLEHLPRQMRIELTGGPAGCSYMRDSGSIILNAAGKILSNIQWGDTLTPCSAGGTRSDYHHIRLGFDSWLDANATNLRAEAAFPSMVVDAGQTAAIYYYIKNFGPKDADDVRIVYEKPTLLPANTTLHWWNSQGQFNIPEDIPAGVTKTFTLGLNNAQGLLMQRYAVHVFGKNAVFDAQRPAENTFAVRWVTSPKPKMIMGSITVSSGDRILHLPPSGQPNYLTYAVLNIGSAPATVNIWAQVTAGLPVNFVTCVLNAQGAYDIVGWPPPVPMALTLQPGQAKWVWIAAWTTQRQTIPATVNSFYTNRMFAMLTDPADNFLLGELGFEVSSQ